MLEPLSEVHGCGCRLAEPQLRGYGYSKRARHRGHYGTVRSTLDIRNRCRRTDALNKGPVFLSKEIGSVMRVARGLLGAPEIQICWASSTFTFYRSTSHKLQNTPMASQCDCTFRAARTTVSGSSPQSCTTTGRSSGPPSSRR